MILPPRVGVLLLATTFAAGSLYLTESRKHPQTPPALEVVPDAEIARFTVDAAREPHLSRSRQIQLLRSKVKYVFVLYQENRSFDSYFGTFPGAEGLFSHPAAQTPGFTQTLINTDGTPATVHPFRIGPDQYAADTDDVDHSHAAIVAKMDIVHRRPRMDRFALVEEKKYSPKGNPTLLARQFGELAMAYEDGDTIPFLWRYANRFVLFDHIFQQMTGPSTPGNLAILGAQTGATQWMRHPYEAYQGNGNAGDGVPVLNDEDPLWGSPADPTKPSDGRMPVNPKDFREPNPYGIQLNLTYATLPLTLAGRSVKGVTSADRDPDGDLSDVFEDIDDIHASGKRSVPWGWYEEGYDPEPTDSEAGADPLDAQGRHASYVTHHNGPQYFGYIANNPTMQRSLHGLNDFYEALDKHSLSAEGGVFYVKGGYRNILGLKPSCPDKKAQKSFRGDDDHPGYSDSRISEALIAEMVNKIAAGPYWNQCAIVITWDDSEGDYDHVRPPLRTVGPDGSVTTDGPRVPLLVLSPYARVHTVAHEVGNHASVVKFIDRVFGLKPLADLPDELAGRAIGERYHNLSNQGPLDDLTPDVCDLLSAFDPARLAGAAPALPPEYVEIPESEIQSHPQSRYGLKEIGIVPVDYQQGLPNDIPADFNPRPRTNPGMHPGPEPTEPEK